MRIACAVCKASAQRRYSVINVPAAIDFHSFDCISLSSIGRATPRGDDLSLFVAQFPTARVQHLQRAELTNRHAHTVFSETSVNLGWQVG
jgi:hypothetical protein